MHEFLEKIQPALIDLAVAVALAAIAFATAWIRAHTRNTRAAGVVDRITTDIDALVAEQAQVIDGFRGTDGKLSNDEALGAKAAVMAKLKALLGPDGIARIVKDVGIESTMVDAWLSAHVERSVRADDPPPTMDVKVVESVSVPATPDVGTANVRDFQKGSGQLAVLLALVILSCATFSTIMLGCSSVKNAAHGVASSVVDCTKRETANTVHDLRPLGDAMLSNALADGKVDWGPVRDVAKGFATDVGRCVLADAVSRALAPRKADPNAPKISPLEVNPDELRAGFRQLAGDLYGGASFKTEAGSL